MQNVNSIKVAVQNDGVRAAGDDRTALGISESAFKSIYICAVNRIGNVEFCPPVLRRPDHTVFGLDFKTRMNDSSNRLPSATSYQHRCAL